MILTEIIVYKGVKQWNNQIAFLGTGLPTDFEII